MLTWRVIDRPRHPGWADAEGPGRRAGGFTLIEVLSATAILAVIVVLLASILNSVSKSWQASSSRNETGLSMRAIDDYIQTDLKGALLPTNASDQKNLQFVLNSPDVPGDVGSASNNYKIGDALFWQSAVANDTTYGDIAEVGYFVKWITNARNLPEPILCRFFVEPTDPAAASSNYLIYSQPTSWLSKQVIDAVAPGTVDKNYSGLFAENVAAIWFRCLDNQGKIYAGRNFDSRTGANDSAGTLQRLPSSVQVSMVVINSEVAARLTTTQQNALIALAGSVSAVTAAQGDSDNTVSPAQSFVSAAQADATLQNIAAGLSVHTTTVSLLNAR